MPFLSGALQTLNKRVGGKEYSVEIIEYFEFYPPFLQKLYILKIIAVFTKW